MHCLIFKMLFSLVGELFHYTTFSFVCQPLFKKFFKLFCGSLSRFRSSFNIISLSKLFVKYFFKFFQKTFSAIASLWQTSFSIISHPVHFINPFSEVFSKFSFCDPNCSVEQLVYYITFHMICQALFSKFLF